MRTTAITTLAVSGFAAAFAAACAPLKPVPPKPVAAAYRLSEVDTRPVLIGCAEMPARGDDNWVGVGVSFRLDESGVPQNLDIGNAVPGHAAYTSRGMTIVKSCRYKPAIKDGVPVAVRGMYRSVRVNIPVAPKT